jgi:proline iminopeptidase
MAALTACNSIPATIEHDAALSFVELDGYKFHVQTFGDSALPPLIVVHGGPGGDFQYLMPLKDLADTHFVILYDQRGTGLSPRVNKEELTLESSLADLHKIVSHYGHEKPVKLIGHSWGAMLVSGYLGQNPGRVSHAVMVEPGMLTPQTAKEFVTRLKATQSWLDAVPMLGYILRSVLVRSEDGHERFDYVMTRLMNRSKPGGPYQCEGQSMPADSFRRAGYAAFSQMLKPVFDDPAKFTRDLTLNLSAYQGRLLMISSECSFIGYSYQEQFHMPRLPAQTMHLEAKAMGHNMLTLNVAWSTQVIGEFFDQPP